MRYWQVYGTYTTLTDLKGNASPTCNLCWGFKYLKTAEASCTCSRIQGQHKIEMRHIQMRMQYIKSAVFIK